MGGLAEMRKLVVHGTIATVGDAAALMSPTRAHSCFRLMTMVGEAWMGVRREGGITEVGEARAA